MHLSDDGFNLVKSFEGYHTALPDGRCKAYLCPAGVPTIGFGCTAGVKLGMVWTRQQAEDAMRSEVNKHEAAVNRLVKVDLTQNQFDALVSFSYNCGTGALSKSTLLKKLNKGDFTGAAREFPKWNKGGGKVLPGLVRRRAQEAELFLTPDDFTEPAMPQAVDRPAPVSDAVKSSRTLSGILATALGGIVYAYQETVQVLLSAAAQIDMLAPAGKVLGGLGLNAAKVAAAITIAGLAYSAFARLHDAATGRNVK